MAIDFEKGNGLVPAIVQDAVTHRVLMLGYMNAEAYQLTLDRGLVTFWSRSRGRIWTKGETSGFNEENEPGEMTSTEFLVYLEDVIQDRRDNPQEGSYTNHLFSRGLNKIAQKVGEEAVELIIASKDDNKELFLGEAADLVYHFLVLLAQKDTKLAEVVDVLKGRHSR